MSTKVHGELVPVGGGDPIPLIRPLLTVGRRDSCDIRMPFPNVSGLHCELSFKDGYWHLRDLNSTNGVKVNGTRVQSKILHPNDEITIAKRRYTIRYELPLNRRAAVEEQEEDVMGQSLLEKAGLERPRRDREPPKPGKGFDPADFLLQDEDD